MGKVRGMVPFWGRPSRQLTGGSSLALVGSRLPWCGFGGACTWRLFATNGADSGDVRIARHWEDAAGVARRLLARVVALREWCEGISDVQVESVFDASQCVQLLIRFCIAQTSSLLRCEAAGACRVCGRTNGRGPTGNFMQANTSPNPP